MYISSAVGCSPADRLLGFAELQLPLSEILKKKGNVVLRCKLVPLMKLSYKCYGKHFGRTALHKMFDEVTRSNLPTV